jgi:hypothetical protein
MIGHDSGGQRPAPLAELRRRIGKGLLHRPAMEEAPGDLFEVITDF